MPAPLTSVPSVGLLAMSPVSLTRPVLGRKDSNGASADGTAGATGGSTAAAAGPASVPEDGEAIAAPDDDAVLLVVRNANFAATWQFPTDKTLRPLRPVGSARPLQRAVSGSIVTTSAATAAAATDAAGAAAAVSVATTDARPDAGESRSGVASNVIVDAAALSTDDEGDPVAGDGERVGPHNIAATTAGAQRRALQVSTKFLMSHSDDVKVLPMFAKLGFCAQLWHVLVAKLSLDRGGVPRGLTAFGTVSALADARPCPVSLSLSLSLCRGVTAAWRRLRHVRPSAQRGADEIPCRVEEVRAVIACHNSLPVALARS